MSAPTSKARAMSRNTTDDSIRREIADFEIRAYQGERYGATVPDTLNLAERPELAINATTRMLCPERDYMMYASAVPGRGPPAMCFSEPWSGARGAQKDMLLHLNGLAS